jgi:hypothetical protein
LKVKIIRQPQKCSFEDKENRESIIFGVKTRPSALEFRQAIRETWLSQKIWEWLGFEIKVTKETQF